MKRKSWDQYFLELAQKISERATCDRAHVGCVLVKNKRVLTTGYNGSLPGQDHCDDCGHLMVDNHCLRTLHSEQNALCTAAKFGISVDGATCYVTHHPCLPCLKALISAGIKKIVYLEEYRKEDIPEEFLNIINIQNYIGV